jgi:hypothetical protein
VCVFYFFVFVERELVVEKDRRRMRGLVILKKREKKGKVLSQPSVT